MYFSKMRKNIIMNIFYFIQDVLKHNLFLSELRKCKFNKIKYLHTNVCPNDDKIIKLCI